MKKTKVMLRVLQQSLSENDKKNYSNNCIISIQSSGKILREQILLGINIFLVEFKLIPIFKILDVNQGKLLILLYYGLLRKIMNRLIHLHVHSIDVEFVF